MESKTILNKIMTMLSVGKQVNLTGDLYGKLEDGTPLATDAFEVGHQLFVIKDNGEKVAAPDGDHITYLPTSNGSKRFIIVVKDGTIQAMELNDGHNSIVNKVNYENDPNLYKQDTNMVQKQELAAMGPDQPGKVTTNDEAQVVKDMEEKGSVSMADGDMASRLDSLDAQLKQLRDDIAAIYSHMKGGEVEAAVEMNADQPGKVTTNDEAAMVKEMQKKGSQMQGPITNAGQVGMSAKKFTGAPVENNQPALNGLLQHKTQDTFSKVLARMANSKF
jgi:hypothetical protein